MAKGKNKKNICISEFIKDVLRLKTAIPSYQDRACTSCRFHRNLGIAAIFWSHFHSFMGRKRN